MEAIRVLAPPFFPPTYAGEKRTRCETDVQSLPKRARSQGRFRPRIHALPTGVRRSRMVEEERYVLPATCLSGEKRDRQEEDAGGDWLKARVLEDRKLWFIAVKESDVEVSPRPSRSYSPRLPASPEQKEMPLGQPLVVGLGIDLALDDEASDVSTQASDDETSSIDTASTTPEIPAGFENVHDKPEAKEPSPRAPTPSTHGGDDDEGNDASDELSLAPSISTATVASPSEAAVEKERPSTPIPSRIGTLKDFASAVARAGSAVKRWRERMEKKTVEKKKKKEEEQSKKEKLQARLRFRKVKVEKVVETIEEAEDEKESKEEVEREVKEPKEPKEAKEEAKDSIKEKKKEKEVGDIKEEGNETKPTEKEDEKANSTEEKTAEEPKEKEEPEFEKKVEEKLNTSAKEETAIEEPVSVPRVAEEEEEETRDEEMTDVSDDSETEGNGAREEKATKSEQRSESPEPKPEEYGEATKVDEAVPAPSTSTEVESSKTERTESAEAQVSDTASIKDIDMLSPMDADDTSIVDADIDDSMQVDEMDTSTVDTETSTPTIKETDEQHQSAADNENTETKTKNNSHVSVPAESEDRKDKSAEEHKEKSEHTKDGKAHDEKTDDSGPSQCNGARLDISISTGINPPADVLTPPPTPRLEKAQAISLKVESGPDTINVTYRPANTIYSHIEKILMSTTGRSFNPSNISRHAYRDSFVSLFDEEEKEEREKPLPAPLPISHAGRTWSGAEGVMDFVEALERISISVAY